MGVVSEDELRGSGEEEEGGALVVGGMRRPRVLMALAAPAYCR